MNVPREISNYVKPELMVVSIALYFISNALKRSKIVNDKYIPLVLGSIGVILSSMYVISTTQITGYQSVLMSLFTGITQGVIVTGLSVHVNRILKQRMK